MVDYAMIAEGDRILCAVSGGKDSFSLHRLLVELQRRAPIQFDLVAVHVDQGHPAAPRGVVEQHLRASGHRCHTVYDDTYSIVRAKLREGETACALCSRLRRAILYRAATELGCNKVALGHHRDDVVVTLLLNLLFTGQLKAMPPRLVSDDGAHVVIRPLVYCAEEDLAAFAIEQAFPIVPCGFCSAQRTERDRIAVLLRELEQRYPDARATMLAALRNVRPSHLLDIGLWEALDLPVTRPPG